MSGTRRNFWAQVIVSVENSQVVLTMKEIKPVVRRCAACLDALDGVETYRL